MKILIICSTSFYDRIDSIMNTLKEKGHTVITPNCYDNPVTSEDNQKKSDEEYYAFFKEMYIESREKIADIDAVLVLNYTKVKNGKEYENYIGTSTFLEMYEAFMQNKKIFVMNNLPDNMLYDDLKGMNPIIINGDIDMVK
jgi:hypothetical protein